MVPLYSNKISRVPLYSRTLLSITPTGLSPSMVSFSKLFRLFQYCCWPIPRSLATTNGISIDFFSSGYLDVSVHRVDEKSWDQCSFDSYPKLIAAFHVSTFSAKTSPVRPYLLDHPHSSLRDRLPTSKEKLYQQRTTQKQQARMKLQMWTISHTHRNALLLLSLLPDCQRSVARQARKKKQTANLSSQPARLCGTQNQTGPDRRGGILSTQYHKVNSLKHEFQEISSCLMRREVETIGLEPTTPGLQSRCSPN